MPAVAPNHLTDVIRALIRALKAGVHPYVVTGGHSDVVELAELPAVVVYLPDATERRIDDANVPEVEKDPVLGTGRVYPPAGVYDLSFGVEIVAERTAEVSAIGQRLLTWVQANPYLAVELLDAQGRSLGTIEYALRGGEPGRVARVEPDNLKRSATVLVVEGVELQAGTYRETRLTATFEAAVENPSTGGSDSIVSGLA